MWPYLLGAGILLLMGDSETSPSYPPVNLPPVPRTITPREAALILRISETSPHLLSWVPITVRAGANTATFWASPDYWGLGSEPALYNRVPLTPKAAQWVADRLDASLPTRKMVNDIERHATLIPFTAFSPRAGESRNSERLWNESNAAIRRRFTVTPGSLVAGHKKDVIIGAVKARNPEKVVIYGARYENGSRVQPTSDLHGDFYVDYSHGIRLVRNTVTVNGVDMPLRQVLQSRAYASLLSDEGPVPTAGLRY